MCIYIRVSVEEGVCTKVGGCGQGRAHGETSDGGVRGGPPTVMGCPGNWLGWIWGGDTSHLVIIGRTPL